MFEALTLHFSCFLTNLIFVTKIYALGAQKPSTFFHRCTRDSWSVLCAIDHQRVVHHRVYSSSGTGVDSERFLIFLRELLEIFPRHKILVLDNARIHHTELVLTVLRDSGISFVFLPEYSPDYTPIELVFNVMKKNMKKFFAQELEAPEVVERVLNNITPESFVGFYRESIRFWNSNTP